MEIPVFKKAGDLFKWWKNQNYYEGISFEYINGKRAEGYDEYKDLEISATVKKGKDIKVILNAFPKEVEISW